MGPAFLIPLALSAAGSAAQYVNQSQANSRQNASEVQALQDQQKYKSQAAQAVSQLTNQVAKSNPAQLQDQATQKYIQQLRQNVGSGVTPGATSALSTQSGADPRYAHDVANANATIEGYGNTVAGQKAGIDSAVRQRQNEGLDMGNLATTLGGINQNSYGTAFADQLRSEAAGTQNPWVSATAAALQNYGSALSKNMAPKAAPVTTTQTPGIMAGDPYSAAAGSYA